MMLSQLNQWSPHKLIADLHGHRFVQSYARYPDTCQLNMIVVLLFTNCATDNG